MSAKIVTPEGFKRCTACKAIFPVTYFGRDSSRWDGLSASCRSCHSARSKKRKMLQPKKGRTWLLPARDGDKAQARSRVNCLVRRGLIPRPNDLPCSDCGDLWSLGKPKHEYDHAFGYSAENQLRVEAVCGRCHAKRGHDRGEMRHEFGKDGASKVCGPENGETLDFSPDGIARKERARKAAQIRWSRS